jgi:uncharacterized protein
MQNVLITGGTGLVGRSLTKALLARGYAVTILTRKLPGNQEGSNTQYALWDVKKQTLDVQAVQRADHIIHLAGAGVVDKKWTEAYKKEIVDSRVKSSELLVKTLSDHSNSIRSVVSASAIGWYGSNAGLPSNSRGFTENDPPVNDFLGSTCRQWEESIEPVTALGKRLVKLRTGIVLSNGGGALEAFKKPLRLGIAAILSGGGQMISWIHIDDLCRMYIHALEDENLSGSYNAVAPVPVDNKKLTVSLARAIRGNFFISLHVPAVLLKLLLGQRSLEVLKSATVSGEKIRASGFVFLYPSIEVALQDLAAKD